MATSMTVETSLTPLQLILLQILGVYNEFITDRTHSHNVASPPFAKFLTRWITNKKR